MGRSADSLDRQTVAIAAVALLLAGGVLVAGVGSGGVAPDRGIYSVGVAQDDPYRDPVRAATSLAARPPMGAAFDRGDLDVLIADDRVLVADTRKGRAAAATLRDAVRSYNARVMAAESNQTAAFPVTVDLRYVTRDTTAGGDVGDGDDGDGGGSGPGSGGGDLGGGGGDGGSGDGPTAGVGGLAGITDGILGGRSSGSPAGISPPFPFGSLVLAFLFLVPMNFVVQAYGSSMLEERINRRGELLLVAPVEPGDIVAGKTLPYFVAMVGLVVAIAVAVGGGPVSVAAVVPIGLVFLAATFAAAMFARSFKELTFVTVSVSVFLTTYAFVPAIFTNVTPVALISPLTIVVRDLQGTAVAPTEYLFSTGPMYLVGVGLFLLGVGIYREEDLFTQRPVPHKLLDALAARIRGRRSAATLAALSIPFVMLAELLALATLFALPEPVALPVLFLLVAGIEEVAKSIHVYAGMHEGPYGRTVGAAVLLGVLAGGGFFVGEKLFVVLQLVGLPSLALGEATAATAGVLPVGALLVAPLVLHAVTASVSAVAATRDARTYVAGLCVAAGIHFVYNLGVVSTLG